tara:strand:+ start:2786 stop:3613 length:828 start_codon:yes stop_codon:yes gene_type:complete
MAKSSWNTGTRVVQDTASSIESTVKSVVETGSQKVSETGGSIWQSVIDGVGSFVEDVPEMVENVEERAGIISDVASKTSTIFKAVTSPVGKNFLNDIMFGRLGSTGGEEVFSQGGLDLMRQLVLDAGILEKGSVTIGKDVYTKLKSDIKINQTGGTSAGGIVKALAEGDPADEIKLILGQFSAEIDENNDIIVTDRFNYNSFINPLDGKEYDAEQYEEAIEQGKFTELEVLMSIFSGEPNYKMVRAAGFVLGSKDYKNDSRDEGRQFKINLGPAN